VEEGDLPGKVWLKNQAGRRSGEESFQGRQKEEKRGGRGSRKNLNANMLTQLVEKRVNPKD